MPSRYLLASSPVHDGRRQQVALDVLLLPLLRAGDLLQRVLPPGDRLGRHAGRADHAAHLLPVERVALLGEGRHVRPRRACACARPPPGSWPCWPRPAPTISFGFMTPASMWPPISAAVTSPPELNGTYLTLILAAFSIRWVKMWSSLCVPVPPTVSDVGLGPRRRDELLDRLVRRLGAHRQHQLVDGHDHQHRSWRRGGCPAGAPAACPRRSSAWRRRSRRSRPSCRSGRCSRRCRCRPTRLMTLIGTGDHLFSSMMPTIMRIRLSVPPPGANGTTTSTFFVGYLACASAAPEVAASSVADAMDTARRRSEFISNPQSWKPLRRPACAIRTRRRWPL